MSITQPISPPITPRPIRPITRDDGSPTARPTSSGRWERALIAAASSLATVAFAFGAPVHPRLFSRHVEKREGS